jgi:hypothetical protein
VGGPFIGQGIHGLRVWSEMSGNLYQNQSYHDGLRVMIFSFALYTNVVDKIL